MSFMFAGCTNFNQDISKWDVRNITYMTSIFYGCKNFNQSLCKWVSNIKDKDVLQQDDYLINQVNICPHYF